MIHVQHIRPFCLIGRDCGPKSRPDCCKQCVGQSLRPDVTYNLNGEVTGQTHAFSWCLLIEVRCMKGVKGVSAATLCLNGCLSGSCRLRGQGRSSDTNAVHSRVF